MRNRTTDELMEQLFVTRSLDPTWWNAAPGELSSDRYMEERALDQDQDADEICANCGHQHHYHEDAYGCEVEGGDRWVDGVSMGGWVARGPCGCKEFEPE